MSSTTDRATERGQVLVLFEGGIVLMFLIAALAFDVGMTLKISRLPSKVGLGIAGDPPLILPRTVLPWTSGIELVDCCSHLPAEYGVMLLFSRTF